MKMTEAQVARIMRQRDNAQKSGLDRLDREAENEGNARRFFKTNEVGPATLGKRIAKNSRQANGNRQTAELKGTNHIVRETARIYSELVRS